MNTGYGQVCTRIQWVFAISFLGISMNAQEASAQLRAEAASTTERVTIFDNFETGTLTDKWNFDGSTLARLVSDSERPGRVLRQALDPSSRQPYRAEMVWRLNNRIDGEEDGRFHPDTNYCIQMSVKVPNWTSPPPFTILMQTKGIPMNNAWGTCSAGRNSITVMIDKYNHRDRLRFNVNTNPQPDAPGGASAGLTYGEYLTRNAWYNLKFHYRPSLGSDGRVRAWINNRKVVDDMGANLDPTDRCNEPTYPHTLFKYGLYTKHDYSGNIQVLFDDVKVTKGSTCD